MNKWKRRLVWVGAVVAVLIFVPFLIPMSSYIKQVEDLASAKLGVPVTIGSMRISLLPSPRLNVGNVVVGKDNEFSVENVSVVPALTSLLSDNKVISSIRVKKPVVKKAALDILANLLKQPKDASSKTTVSVRQVNIKDAKLEWPDLKLPEIDADIALEENKPESAEIETTDGKLKIKLIPQDKHQEITLIAKNWTVPAGLPLLMDELRMEMVLTDNQLDIPKIDATLYGGRLTGDANLTWGKAYKLTGNTKLDNVAVREPTRLISKTTHTAGQLFSTGHFSSTANEPAQLADKINADIKFNVKDGIFYGFDLAKIATTLLTSGGSGGETKFDEFSGLLNISGKTYRFHDLKVSSGALAATGGVKIGSDKSLDGEIEVEAKNTMKIGAIPMQVSGTLDHPMILPTKAALAGAVAGAAVLGPVGAGIGIKASQAIKGLFGGSDKK